MINQIKFLTVLIALFIAFPLIAQDSEPAPRTFVGVGAGLNPLCLLISEDHFACTTQASIYAASDNIHSFGKLDKNYVYLSNRRSDTDEKGTKNGDWGPRNLNLSSWIIGFSQRAFEASFLPITLGIGGGRYIGHNIVLRTSYSKSPENPSDSSVSTLDEYAVRGTIFHFHCELESRELVGKNSHIKVLINIDSFYPDEVGADAFATRTVLTMPTPQIFLVWNI